LVCLFIFLQLVPSLFLVMTRPVLLFFSPWPPPLPPYTVSPASSFPPHPLFFSFKSSVFCSTPALPATLSTNFPPRPPSHVFFHSSPQSFPIPAHPHPTAYTSTVSAFSLDVGLPVGLFLHRITIPLGSFLPPITPFPFRVGPPLVPVQPSPTLLCGSLSIAFSIFFLFFRAL